MSPKLLKHDILSSNKRVRPVRLKKLKFWQLWFVEVNDFNKSLNTKRVLKSSKLQTICYQVLHSMKHMHKQIVDVKLSSITNLS